METREKIIRKAALAFSRGGYFGVSMQEIADSVGVSKPALYYHFANKEDLYLEVLRRTFSALFSSLEEAVGESRNPPEALFRLIEAYLQFALKAPAVNLLFDKEVGELSEIKKFLGGVSLKLRKLFEETLAQGGVRPVKFFASLLLNLLGGFILRKDSDPRKLARGISKLFLGKD